MWFPGGASECDPYPRRPVFSAKRDHSAVFEAGKRTFILFEGTNGFNNHPYEYTNWAFEPDYNRMNGYQSSLKILIMETIFIITLATVSRCYLLFRRLPQKSVTNVGIRYTLSFTNNQVL